MEPAGLLSLPIELVHHLSSFLSVEDVLTCSLTCHYLRFALNDNRVWKRYLPEQDLTRLETLKQHVQPTFQLEQALTPLCDNRVQFIRKTRLLNNWREGNFVEFSTDTGYRYAHGVMFNVTKAKGELVYRDKYLFVSRYINEFDSGSIEVWDVEDAPTLFTKVKMDNVNYESFYVIGDYFVVVECIRVNVYSINVEDKSISLAFSFLITEEDISQLQEINHPGRHDIRWCDWLHSTAGQYLASSKREEDVLHVWDIVNASKVGSFTPPVYGVSINIFSHVGNDWLIFQKSPYTYDYYLFHFNIENREFADRFFHYQGRWIHMINYECYIILFKFAEEHDLKGRRDTICELYDFKTSKKLKTRRFDDRKRNTGIKTTKVFNGTFVKLCSDGFHIIDARTLDTVERFQCDSDVSFISRHWNVHGSVFVAVVKKNYMLEIWDVHHKKKVSAYLKQHGGHLYFNDLHTVLASFERMKINVVHFW